MAGRPPTPTALKLLRGNPGKRKLNDREPKPKGVAKMPDWFMKDATLVAEWKRQAPRLLALGLLTELDGDALATLCVLEVRFRRMVEDGEASAMALGNVSKEKRALWSRFGMTPADRVRVKVDPKPAASKLERFTG